MYALTDGVTTTPLLEGKNVVGRSAVPVEGVSFVSLESPRAAISRMQAFIDIAANGDAWIADCNSTNGTFLSVHEGTGVRLEPNHYYQLSPGCRIVFGDVERQFVLLQAGGCTHAPSTSTGGATAATTPYLQKDDVVRARRDSPKASSRKRAASPVGSLSTSPQKAARTRATTVVSTSASHSPLITCFTGMDSDEKAEAKKAVKRLGGRTVEDVRKANLLVVKAPATRTPKFLIAVGRGIPIATEKILDADTVTPEVVEKHGASLHHDNSHTYTTAALHKAIHRGHHVPILEGLSFNLTELPAKLRTSSQEVIVGCGGEVKKAKKGATVLSEKTLNDLYDSILRGKRPAWPSA